jgi:hypothetical protein
MAKGSLRGLVEMFLVPFRKSLVDVIDFEKNLVRLWGALLLESVPTGVHRGTSSLSSPLLPEIPLIACLMWS